MNCKALISAQKVILLLHHGNLKLYYLTPELVARKTSDKALNRPPPPPCLPTGATVRTQKYTDRLAMNNSWLNLDEVCKLPITIKFFKLLPIVDTQLNHDGRLFIAVDVVAEAQKANDSLNSLNSSLKVRNRQENQRHVAQ